MATKTLGILVEAQGAAKAAGLIGKVDQSVQRLGSRGGLLSTFGSKVGYAGRQLGGLAASFGPLLGVTGVVGLSAAFGSSIGKATEFGESVAKLAPLLNLPTQAASALVDTLDKFGIAGDKQVVLLGRMEKNAGVLAGTSKKAAAFQKQFGFSLLGANGQIADSNTLLQRSADYFNSNAKASDKAQVLTKLYGKTWADLIPLLKLGSQGIANEEQNAIHLTDAQLANMDKFKTAQRNFADAIGDLQVKVGAELMPSITGALQTVSTWLDSHSDEVVSFFKGAADFGAQLADGAGKAFAAIQTGWNMIPGPLKTLLIEGLIAGKVTKFLFDFGPMDFAKLGANLVGGAIKGILGINAGVVNVNAGVVNGPGGLPNVLPAAGAAAGGAGTLGLAGGVAVGALAASGIGIALTEQLTAGPNTPRVGGGSRGFLPGVRASDLIPGTNLLKPTRPLPVEVVNGAPASSIGVDARNRAVTRSPLPADTDQRKNLAMAAILQRATAKGFRPTQAAVTATYERDVARSTALTARKSADIEAAVKANATTIVAGIVGAIRGLGQPIVNVNVSASDIVRIQNQRRRTVKPLGPRGDLIGANEFG